MSSSRNIYSWAEMSSSRNIYPWAFLPDPFCVYTDVYEVYRFFHRWDKVKKKFWDMPWFAE